jgi:tetratricopeptide (TPR) repeat protein
LYAGGQFKRSLTLKNGLWDVTLSPRFTVTTYPRQLFAVAFRVLIAAACVVGIWNSVKTARADFLFRQDMANSLRSAIHLEPDAWEYYMRLAQLDEDHAPELLETALRLNPFNAQADIELGLRAEAEGDVGKAQRFLLQAFAVDDTYVPRWTLAGFYLRRGNINAFWAWARKAAEMPADDMGALFDLCWHVSPNPEEIAGNILNNSPSVNRQYLDFLLRKDQLTGIEAIAQRLIRIGALSVDRPLLFSLVNRMLAAKDATGAAALWHSLIEQRWVAGSETTPYNAEFARDPLPVGFDWTLPSYPGLHSWPGRPGLETEFTGDEPEDCPIAEQSVVLNPGSYLMEYTYRTAGIPLDTGIHWQIVDANSGTVLADSAYLSSETGQQAALSFSVGRETALVRLRLVYKRVPGTSRLAGTLTIASTEVHRSPRT